MKWIILRKAVLQEDEGIEHFYGYVDADDEFGAKERAAKLWGGDGYFTPWNFQAFEDGTIEPKSRLRPDLSAADVAKPR